MEEFKVVEFEERLCASNIFNSILKQIQDSHLNFHLKLSPFSAEISLIKSFIKDKSGHLLKPSSMFTSQLENIETVDSLIIRNQQLQQDLDSLQKKFIDKENDHKISIAKINNLETTLKSMPIKTEFDSCIDKLKAEKQKLADMVKDYENTIENLNSSSANLVQIVIVEFRENGIIKSSSGKS